MIQKFIHTNNVNYNHYYCIWKCYYSLMDTEYYNQYSKLHAINSAV